MSADTLANTILITHAIYICIVIGGVPLIVIGKFRHWRWVHNAWFRGVHFLMIAIVALESIFGIRCPLTVWGK